MTEQMLVEVLVFLGLMATLGAITKIALAFIHRRRLTQDPAPQAIERLTQQITQLQHSVDAAAVEIERLGEGQRFTTKLLSDRASSPAPR
jgi:hypothetical protein